LSNSDFLTGAFPAEYGDVLGCVFYMKLRQGNKDKREYTFQAGVMGAEMAAEGPFSKTFDASYLINYRYSTFQYVGPFIGMETAPKAALNHRYPLSSKSFLNTTLSVSASKHDIKDKRFDDNMTFQPFERLFKSLGKYTITSNVTQKVSPKHTNRTGVTLI
jgi:hypothetical protein